MNVNSTTHSLEDVKLRPCAGRTVPNHMAGSIASVGNQSVDFDSKPSCWSFVGRALASLPRKIVSVCQAIPHKLSCSTSTARIPVSVSTETYFSNQVNHHDLPNRNNHYDYYVLPMINNRERGPASQQCNRPHLLNQVSDGEHKTPKPPVAAPRTLKPAPWPAGTSGQNDIVYAELDLARLSKSRTVSVSLISGEKTIYATIQSVGSTKYRPSLSKT